MTEDHRLRPPVATTGYGNESRQPGKPVSAFVKASDFTGSVDVAGVVPHESGNDRGMTDDPAEAIEYEFDLAVSFAGEDREYVSDVVEGIKNHHKVFYDEHYQVE